MNVIQKFTAAIEGAYEAFKEIFGVNGLDDMLHSLFIVKFLKTTLLFSSFAAFLDLLAKKWLGMSVDVYLLFIIGLLVDMVITIYIVLFIHNKKVEKSKLIGKTMLKILVYSFIFAATFRFKTHFSTAQVFNIPSDIFEWLHSSITLFCFLQLILGLLKRTTEAGFEETKGLPKFIRDKIKQIADAGTEKEKK